MTTEAIEKICAAETEAEKIEKEAAERAEAMLDKAKADAETMLREAKQSGERLVDDAIEAAKAEGASLSAKNAQNIKAALEKLEAAANGKMDGICELVRKKLISG